MKLPEFSEGEALMDASSLLSAENNKAEIVIYSEEDPEKFDPKQKSKFARPFKPAIYME
jgi:leucyl-tRNA synthetase